MFFITFKIIQKVYTDFNKKRFKILYSFIIMMFFAVSFLQLLTLLSSLNKKELT